MHSKNSENSEDYILINWSNSMHSIKLEYIQHLRKLHRTWQHMHENYLLNIFK